MPTMLSLSQISARYSRTTLGSKKTFEYACVGAGVATNVLFFVGLLAGSMMPPLAPAHTAEQVVSHYKRHLTGIRVLATLVLWSGPLYIMWTAVCSSQMKRIPGVPHAVTATQLASGALGAVGFYVPAILFATTAYRPERPPEITMALNDLSWIFTVFGFSPVITQNVAFGWAILADLRPKPLFPRWLGWMNVIFPFGLSPGMGLHFVHHGPIAWNGWVTFWLGFVWFGGLTGANIMYLILAINNDMPREAVEDVAVEELTKRDC